MKRLTMGVLAVVVCLAFASTVFAAKKATVEAKEEVQGHEIWTLVKAKTPDEKETLKTQENYVTGDVKVIDISKHKYGDLWKDTVKVHKYEEGSDFIYVLKDDKVYRIALKEGAKTPGMKLKKGDTINIVSTYPLTTPEIQQYVFLHQIEKLK